MAKKNIFVSVSNDLCTDQRVHKVCTYLVEKQHNVCLIGRKLRTSNSINRDYKTRRLSLLFNSGFLFYAALNFRLFFYLLFRKTHILLANDLDTLPANFLVSRIKGIKLVYDAHELFCEVPELNDRKFVKAFWQKIEAYIIPKLKNCYTVNESLAKIYTKKYGVPFEYVMNKPAYQERTDSEKNELFTVIYQGAVNKDRGLEHLIEAFKPLRNEDIQLWIVGDGDIKNHLVEQVKKEHLDSNIEFKGQIPFENLAKLTQKAHLGVSLELDTNLNYRFASPNKVFDYIAAHVPVLCSNLPEMKKIIDQYQVGLTIEQVHSKNIANSIISIKNNYEQYSTWMNNCKNAAKELCWENEVTKLDAFF